MNLDLIKNHAGHPIELPKEVRERLRNASQLPKLYYGLHFSEGVAEYREKGKEPYRVLILENAAKQMDRTFVGCPVVVLHTDEELDDMLPEIMDKADGFVVESFFNRLDGKHWAMFLAITDRAHDAIAKGWTLSNCYKIKDSIPSNGQQWHGVDYSREIKEGVFEHLAIVPNPRYESKVFTPEQFKAYNSNKEIELERLANSTNEGEGSMKLNFFKRQKVENAIDIENTVVELPKSKKQMTVLELANAMDVIENMAGYCNMDHMVKVGEEEMTVNDLVDKFSKMNADKMAADEAAAEGAGAQNDDDEDAVDEDGLENEEDAESKKKKDAEEKKANALKEKAEAERVKNAAAKEKKEKGKDHFEALSNAADLAALKNEKEESVLDTERAQIARGQDRYGSAKK
jgi:hypothetical protein